MDFKVVGIQVLGKYLVSIPNRDFSGFQGWGAESSKNRRLFQSLIGILVDFKGLCLESLLYFVFKVLFREPL